MYLKQKKGIEPSTFAMAKQRSTTELFLPDKFGLCFVNLLNGKYFYLLRELNPCFCLEKATSLPLDEKDFILVAYTAVLSVFIK